MSANPFEGEWDPRNGGNRALWSLLEHLRGVTPWDAYNPAIAGQAPQFDMREMESVDSATRRRLSGLMNAPQYQTALPDAWMVRQMAAPQMQAAAQEQGRLVSMLGRQGREMGPGASSAALRQQALAQMSGQAGNALSGAQTQLFNAENQRRQMGLQSALGATAAGGQAMMGALTSNYQQQYGTWADLRAQLFGQQQQAWDSQVQQLLEILKAFKA